MSFFSSLYQAFMFLFHPFSLAPSFLSLSYNFSKLDPLKVESVQVAYTISGSPSLKNKEFSNLKIGSVFCTSPISKYSGV